MSAPENTAHDINMHGEVAVATSLETSSAKGSPGQEFTLNSEGPPTDIRGESGSSADDVNDRDGTSGQVPGSPPSASASSAELVDQDSDGMSEAASGTNQEQSNRVRSDEDSDGASQSVAGTDQEQSDEVNSTAPPAVVPQRLNQEPMSSRITANDSNEEAVPMNSTATEQGTQPRATDEAARLSASINVPPHMRPGFVAPVPRRPEHAQSRVPPYNRNTRGNGSRSNIPQYEYRHDHINPAEIVRLNAQILKIQNDLVAERTKNRDLRQKFESDQRQHLETAFSSMLSNLLHEQLTALALKARVEAKERDILMRERKVAQIERLLVEGQRQLFRGIDEHQMTAAQLDHTRRETELGLRHQFADREAKLAVKSEELRLLAEAQVKREENYKILIREALRAEIKQQILAEETEKMAENVYKRGFRAGKQEFLQGYHACYRAQAMLSMFRKGELARDSPELEFLFDPSHPDNMFNMAVQIGRLDLHGAESEASGVEANMPAPMAESNHGSETNNGTIEETTQVSVRQSTVAMGYTAPGLASYPRTPSRSPPRYNRPTLAAELRGPSPTYNGRIILANNDALRASTPEVAGAPVVQNNHGAPNLIDLL